MGFDQASARPEVVKPLAQAPQLIAGGEIESSGYLRVRRVESVCSVEFGAPTYNSKRGTLPMPFTSAADVVEKVRNARERLMTQGNPLGIVNRGEKERHTTLPTYEREGKAAHGFAEVVLRSETGRYTTTKRERSPIEAHQKSFSEAELHVAAMFVADAEAATRVNITAAYDGAPRAVSGPRAGGVIDKRREAHARFYAMKKAIGDDSEFWMIAERMVLEHRHEATGKGMSMAELGALLLGLKHEATCRGGGIVGTKATLWRLAEEYRKGVRVR